MSDCESWMLSTGLRGRAGRGGGTRLCAALAPEGRPRPAALSPPQTTRLAWRALQPPEVVRPDARRERLRRVRLPRPLEHLGKVVGDAVHLVPGLLAAVRAPVGVVRLVPDVLAAGVASVPHDFPIRRARAFRIGIAGQDGDAHPAEDAGVVLEAPDDAGDVRPQARLRGARRVRERGGAGALHPPRVVDARRGVPLLAQGGERVPARVEEDEERPDLAGGAEGEELVEAGDEPVLRG